MDIRQLLGLPDLLSVHKVICVQPHPDDNELGAAGTIIELTRRACEIAYITVTDGRSGAFGTASDPTDLVRQRLAEKERAGEIIGVTKHFDLGFRDGGSYPEEEVTQQLVCIFREFRPDLVMTVDPWAPYESHPDHLKTGRAVSRALLFSNNAIIYPVRTAALVEVPQVAFYATSYPNTFVDISAHWNDKLAAIFAHQSQFDHPDWPELSSYFSYAAQELYRQWKRDPNATGYAEAFKVLATKQLHFVPTAVFD